MISRIPIGWFLDLPCPISGQGRYLHPILQPPKEAVCPTPGLGYPRAPILNNITNVSILQRVNQQDFRRPALQYLLKRWLKLIVFMVECWKGMPSISRPEVETADLQAGSCSSHGFLALNNAISLSIARKELNQLYVEHLKIPVCTLESIL